MGEVLYKHNGVMFEHRTVQNMTDLTNSSSVTKTAAAAAASNETSGVLTMSSVSLLYQYFAFMSYFMGSGNATKCYGNLGCLQITDEWYGMTRPVNVLPVERHIINTRFLLTTRESLQQPRFLNLSQPHTVLSSPFDGTRPTKIIIHGFIDTGFVPWISEMTNLFLLNEDVNVIVVDWGGGSSGLYSQTAANTRLVGLEVAALIDYLMEYKGGRLEDFHIIGHSLGAHIAGYAGERLKAQRKRKLGRITALDPAQPLFQGMPDFVRLDRGDANFVDVIHTDAKSILMGGYGMEIPCGHVDFYPNGGFDQPGCSLFDMPVSLDSMTTINSQAADTMGRHLVACSHNRGIGLYIDSLRSGSKCQMVAHQCDSFADFDEGRCFDCGFHGEKCATLGEKAIDYKPFISDDKKPLKFYLKTGKKSPFCQHHYLLEFNLAQPKAAERWVQGFLKVNLYGTRSEITEINLTPDRLRLAHGDEKRFLVHTESISHGYDHIISLEAYWLYRGDYTNPHTYCLWSCNDTLFVRNVTVRGLIYNGMHHQPEVERTVVCGDSEEGYATIKSGEWKLFYKQC